MNTALISEHQQCETAATSHGRHCQYEATVPTGPDKNDVMVQPSATAIGRNRDCSSRTQSPSARDGKLNLQVLRDELRKGVRFAELQEREQNNMHRGYEATRALDALDSARLSGDLVDYRGVDQDSINQLDQHMEHGMRLCGSSEFSDEDDDSEEIAAFLGVSIPSNQTHELALQHRAASFSGSSRPRLVPCSPPVPIPQKHWSRRNSLSGSTASRSSSGSMLIPSHEHQYSRTQCEARLWDEYWNYKLSLESRESFEASTGSQRDGRESPLPGKPARSSHTINQDQNATPRTTSEASTEDTTRDSSDEFGEAAEPDVFAMDDF